MGGTLIDGTGSAPVADSVVLIEKGRIVAAGSRSVVKIPHGATKIDARGKTILPGLWDMHAHFEQVEWGPIYLAAGVTTVRDCGNEFEFITAVATRLRMGGGLVLGCCSRELWTERGRLRWEWSVWIRPSKQKCGRIVITTQGFSR